MTVQNKLNMYGIETTNSKYEIHLTWTEFGLAIHELSKQILKDMKYDYDGIYPIPRGGNIIGEVLSRHLNLKILEEPTDRTLVVDDISDTGKTLDGIKHKKIACLYSTPWTKVKPDYYIYTKFREIDWIVFPWELK